MLALLSSSASSDYIVAPKLAQARIGHAIEAEAPRSLTTILAGDL
jgi:hypothetical protein